VQGQRRQGKRGREVGLALFRKCILDVEERRGRRKSKEVKQFRLSAYDYSPYLARENRRPNPVARRIHFLDGLHEYACGALGRAPGIHALLPRLATKPCEKRGLAC
jgi:hypothetical protein